MKPVGHLMAYLWNNRCDQEPFTKDTVPDDQKHRLGHAIRAGYLKRNGETYTFTAEGKKQAKLYATVKVD